MHRGIYLSVAILATAVAATTASTRVFPSRDLPASFERRLRSLSAPPAASTSSLHVPFFTAAHQVITTPPPEPTCPYAFTPVLASFLTGTYLGNLDDFIYADPKLSFFRFALGWDAARIKAETDAVAAHLKAGYGISPDTPGVQAGAVALDVTLRAVASSDVINTCANLTAVVGGFIVGGTNITYGGSFAQAAVGKDRVVAPGFSALYSLFIVINPGTPFVLAIKFVGERPVVCEPFGVCALNGAWATLDSSNRLAGQATLTFVFSGNGDGNGTVVANLASIMPGYLPPENL